MYEDLIRYDKLIDSAMRFVVKEALKEVCNVGLKGDHHFLLSFITDADGVEIPKTLKERYPNEMTIVIQHQFENLIINDDRFSVTLSFDGKKEAIVVPFMALTSFADPGVKFGLKFNLVDFWNAIYDRTRVTFVYYGWISKSQKINEYIDSSLDPNLISDISNIILDHYYQDLNKSTFSINILLIYTLEDLKSDKN